LDVLYEVEDPELGRFQDEWVAVALSAWIELLPHILKLLQVCGPTSSSAKLGRF
jgi:hypothetical protein